MSIIMVILICKWCVESCRDDKVICRAVLVLLVSSVFISKRKRRDKLRQHPRCGSQTTWILFLFSFSHKTLAVVVSLKLRSDWLSLLWWAWPGWSSWFMNSEPENFNRRRAWRTQQQTLINQMKLPLNDSSIISQVNVISMIISFLLSYGWYVTSLTPFASYYLMLNVHKYLCWYSDPAEAPPSVFFFTNISCCNIW